MSAPAPNRDPLSAALSRRRFLKSFALLAAAPAAALAGVGRDTFLMEDLLFIRRAIGLGNSAQAASRAAYPGLRSQDARVLAQRIMTETAVYNDTLVRIARHNSMDPEMLEPMHPVQRRYLAENLGALPFPLIERAYLQEIVRLYESAVSLHVATAQGRGAPRLREAASQRLDWLRENLRLARSTLNAREFWPRA